MVAHNAAYWARRKTESRQLSEADRLELVAAYQRLGKNVAAAARDRKVSKTAAARWIGQWLRTGSIVSTKRGNSGRPRTATSPAVVAKVVKLMNSPADGEHVPSAREVKRKLKLPFSDESVRKAAKRGGFKFRRKRNRPYLTAKQRLARLRWARAMLRVRHDWRRTMCTDGELVGHVEEEARAGCGGGRRKHSLLNANMRSYSRMLPNNAFVLWLLLWCSERPISRKKHAKNVQPFFGVWFQNEERPHLPGCQKISELSSP